MHGDGAPSMARTPTARLRSEPARKARTRGARGERVEDERRVDGCNMENWSGQGETGAAAKQRTNKRASAQKAKEGTVRAGNDIKIERNAGTHGRVSTRQTGRRTRRDAGLGRRSRTGRAREEGLERTGRTGRRDAGQGKARGPAPGQPLRARTSCREPKIKLFTARQHRTRTRPLSPRAVVRLPAPHPARCARYQLAKRTTARRR